MTRNLHAKIGKKWTKLNRNVSVRTDIDEKSLCFLNALLTIFLLAMFIYPDLNVIFVFAYLIFCFFSFRAIYF